MVRPTPLICRLDGLVMMIKRIQEIIDIVKSLDNNDAAQWSQVTHVIFGDFNIGKSLIQEARNNKDGWIDYIQSIANQNSDDNNSHLMNALKEIIAVDEALFKLSTYTDDELDEAQDALLNYGEWVSRVTNGTHTETTP